MAAKKKLVKAERDQVGRVRLKSTREVLMVKLRNLNTEAKEWRALIRAGG